MKGHGQKLSRKQEQAVMALLTSGTIREAAAEVGVAESTIFRWMQMPQFEELYREARHRALGQTIARLQQATTEAVDTLRDVMGDEEAASNSRVTAAKAVLEMAFKAYELEDLAQQVKELEQLVKENMEQDAT